MSARCPNCGHRMSAAHKPAGERWTAAKKAAEVIAVRRGDKTAEQVCAEHAISAAEWSEWNRLFDLDGERALQVGRLQIARAFA